MQTGLALVPRLEATGAAIAYMVSMVAMYGYLSSVVMRQLHRSIRGLPSN